MTASAEQRSFRLTSFIWSALLRFFDGSKDRLVAARAQLPDRIDWARSLPFVLMHLACLAAILTGVSPVGVVVAIIAYLLRMFALTRFYHRYFSYSTVRTSRVGQFVFGLL